MSRLKNFSAILDGDFSTEIEDEQVKKSGGLLVKLKNLKPVETASWCKEFLALYKIKISFEALSDLVAGTKNDFNKIFQVLRLLILSGHKEITQDTLAPLRLPKSHEFSIAEAFFQKLSFANFIKSIRQDPFMQAITSIQLQALRLLAIKLEKKRKLFNVAPVWFRKQSAGLIDKWSNEELFKVLLKALKSEEDFKTYPSTERSKIFQFASEFFV